MSILYEFRGYDIESTVELTDNEMDDLVFAYEKHETRHRQYSSGKKARIRKTGDNWRFPL